jgi:hypothetical protein
MNNVCHVSGGGGGREKNVQSVESRIFKSDFGLDWTHIANQALSIRIKIRYSLQRYKMVFIDYLRSGTNTLYLSLRES